MMKWLVKQRYDRTDTDALLHAADTDGYVIGDPFCQKRMFRLGEAEILLWAQLFHDCGKKVMFQSPCYLTERRYDDTLSLTLLLAERGLADHVLVQDVGFASRLHKDAPRLQLIWSRYAATRNNAENLAQYEFLKEIGVSAVEVMKPEHVPYLHKLGFGLLYADTRLSFRTVNRICYYKHEYDVYNGDCRRACLSHPARMVNENCGIDMTIDGFMLGLTGTPTDLKNVVPAPNDIGVLHFADIPRQEANAD